MTTYWSCPNLPSEGTDSICCFANSTCADYVCGHFGSNITTDTSGGGRTMHNCFVSNGTEATELYMNPPANGTCSFDTQGNGCVVRLDTNETVTSTVGGSATSSMGGSATSSAPAASSSGAGSGGSSDGIASIGGVNQGLLLGMVGVSWMIKKIWN
ncbi:hypothetical protein I302_103409 [Kwoniella bestiolae CBS 10118]|uniref:Uncharacterized protein n=1 Tax=Kwoniella bestiolae CBS 10118 TaxID=1296100 RepID=A0A1B9G8C0_9TREE|nr:hypothetical protein I302_02109 [Kwoniella bestiolae CBS 10118]OCF27269.1 hypothetical protein I302_02109 [Kwoniella bestiolae CBS 10118]